MVKDAGDGAFAVKGDEGNRNYGKSGDIYGNTAKVTSEVSLKYGDWGAFVRGSYFYDFENATKNVPSSRARKAVGEDAQLLDEFIDKEFTFGETGTGNVRFGRQVRSEEHTSEFKSVMRSSYAVFCLIQK